jgi:hypothetical protein
VIAGPGADVDRLLAGVLGGAVDDVPQDHPVVVGGQRLARREDAVELGAVERHAAVVVRPRAEPLGVLVEATDWPLPSPCTETTWSTMSRAFQGSQGDRFDH